MKVSFKTGSEANYGSTNGELFFASNTKQIMLNGIKYIPKKLSELTNDSGFLTSITKSMVEGVLTGNITSHTHTFASITSKPDTLLGYGITETDFFSFDTHISKAGVFFRNDYANNLLYAIDKRADVTATTFTNISSLFNLNYDSPQKIEAGDTEVILIENLNTVIPMLAYGYLYVQLYWGNYAENITVEVYSKNGGADYKWRALSGLNNIYLWTFNNVNINYDIDKIRIAIKAKSDTSCLVSQILFLGRRMSINNSPLITNYIPNTFLYDVTAPKYVVTGGTSSQFLKGDGSLDSNTYALSSTLNNYLPLSGGTMTGTLNMPGQQINAGSITTSTYINADSISANSISCGDKDVSLNGHTHTFASITNKPTTLGGYGITDIKHVRGYNCSNGCLVKTKVSDTGTFVRLHIYGTTNSSSLSKGFKPICTIVDCFNFDTKTIELNATHFGDDFGNISAFIYNGYLCFWFKQPRKFTAFNVYGYITNKESDVNNIISGITNQSIPSENVSNLITVTPTKIAYTFGTSSQFLKGDGSLDSNTYALSSALGNYLPLTGGTLSGALTCNGYHIDMNNDSGSRGYRGFFNQSNNTNRASGSHIFMKGGGYALGADSVSIGYQAYAGIRNEDADKTTYPYIAWQWMPTEKFMVDTTNSATLSGGEYYGFPLLPNEMVQWNIGGQNVIYENSSSYKELLVVIKANDADTGLVFGGKTTLPYRASKTLIAGKYIVGSGECLKKIDEYTINGVKYYQVIIYTWNTTAFPTSYDFTQQVKVMCATKVNNSNYNGVSSYASGISSVASGNSSVASGYSSVASGYSSVASGYSSVASGNYSVASGNYSVASGDSSVASGDSSVASDYFSVASGYYSVASGYSSVASGSYSVAKHEGSKVYALRGISGANYQTVLGRDNVETTGAVVVGWGSSDASRKNIFVLDTSGNATFGSGGAASVTATTFNGSLNGNAATATTAAEAEMLKTACSIKVGNTAKSFNGTQSSLSWTLADIGAAAASHTHTFDSITNKPTTLNGYGIEDAYTKTETNTELGKYLPLTGGTLNGALTVPTLTSTGGILLGDSSLSAMVGSVGIQRHDETGFIGFLKDFNLGNSFNGIVLGWDGNYQLSTNSVRIDASTFTYKGNNVWHSGNLKLGYISSGLSRAVQKDTNGNLFIVAPSLFEQGISNNYPKNLRWSNETEGQLVYDKELDAGNFDIVEIGIPLANGASKGFLKSTSTVTNVTGYTPCPVVSGTPYYKLDAIELDYTDFLEIGSGSIESHLPITIKVQAGGSLEYLFGYTVDNIPRLLTISTGNFCKYFFWLQQTDDDTPIVAYYHCQFNNLWLVIDSPNMEVRISQGSF